MKVFISQNMKNRADEEILAEREELIKRFHITKDELIDSFITDENKTPVEMLGKSIELLGQADLALIPSGHRNRGVEIEYQVATKYGIERIYY